MTSRLRSALRRRAAEEAGFSLPELLVTITLMSIVSAAIVASTVAVQRNLGTANATMRDLASNRITVERVGGLLRGAVAPYGILDVESSALEVATADRVRLYSITGVDQLANPIMVELAVEDGDLVERIWYPYPALIADLPMDTAPTYDPAFAPYRERVIGRNLLSSEVFTYWTHADDGSPLGRCGRELITPTTDERKLVDAISFRLVVQEPTGYRSAPSDLQGWARFASAVDLGVSTGLDSAGCLDGQGFGYQEAYTSP